MTSIKEVTDKTFFHTPSTENARIFFDNNNFVTIDPKIFNPRYQDLTNFKKTVSLNKGEVGWLKYLDYLIENNKQHQQMPKNWADLLENITDASYRLNNRYYETIFEEIRQKEFPLLPSRYSCIYLADQKNIELWHKKTLKELKTTQLPIYQFKATGQIHYADANWLEVDIVSNDEYSEIAKKYWMGCKSSEDALMEILFCGTLTLEKKYNNIDEFLSSC